MGIADLLQNAGATPTTARLSGGGVGGLLSAAKTGTGIVPTPTVATVTSPAPQPGIVSKLLNIPKDFISGLASSYGSAAASIPNDIQEGASDIEKSVSQPAPVVPTNQTREQALEGLQNDSAGNELVKGLIKSGARPAGDVAGAVFAPLSAAIGSVIKDTGAQSLLDDSGNVIANKTGITDMPAFQKFALAHPNAGPDFQRILNLALSGGENSKVDPVKTAQEAKTLAQTIVSDAKQPPEPPTATVPAEPLSGIDTFIKQAQGTQETPLDMSTLVDSSGKHDLRTAMTGLSDGGYTMKQISNIMGKVIENNDSGRFTPQEISAVARKFKPRNPVLASDASVIKTTSGNPVTRDNFGSLGYEPTSDTPFNTPAKTNGAVVPDESSGKPTPEIPQAPEAGKSSKAASDINMRLAEKGLDALPEDQLAKFTPTTKAEQLVKISNILDSNPERAAQMALGHIPVEEGIHPVALFNAVASAAEESGNMKLTTDLMSSPHAAGSSLHGQGLSVSRFFKGPDSVMTNLQRIRDLKIDSIGKDVAEKARSAALKEGGKVNLSKEDLSWNKFLDKITC